MPGAPTVTGCRVPGRCATEATACRGSTLTSVTHSSWSSTDEEARHAEFVRDGGELGERLGLQVVRDAGGEGGHARAERDAPAGVARDESVVLERAQQPVRDRAVHAEPLARARRS